MPVIYQNPKEYKLKPTKGIISGLSSIFVNITLTPNLERFKQLEVVVEVFESDKCRSSIRVTHNGVIPRIICVPDEIHIRFCFIGYPANRVLRLKNTTQLPTQFRLVSLEDKTLVVAFNWRIYCTEKRFSTFSPL